MDDKLVLKNNLKEARSEKELSQRKISEFRQKTYA